MQIIELDITRELIESHHASTPTAILLAALADYFRPQGQLTLNRGWWLIESTVATDLDRGDWYLTRQARGWLQLAEAGEIREGTITLERILLSDWDGPSPPQK